MGKKLGIQCLLESAGAFSWKIGVTPMKRPKSERTKAAESNLLASDSSTLFTFSDGWKYEYRGRVRYGRIRFRRWFPRQRQFDE